MCIGENFELSRSLSRPDYTAVIRPTRGELDNHAKSWKLLTSCSGPYRPELQLAFLLKLNIRSH